MSGDYSRFTDRPGRRYSGVLMQQGRVQLDADWNEHVDIAQRRWEVQAADTFGLSGVPRATTPDGFKISPPSAGDFAIAPGRIYVDGKLAELFDGEQVGVPPVVVSYKHQPFYPDPPALPAGAVTVFLDVWDREVTYVEDPDILEKALGGPDTATRRQTAWQVRVQPAGAGTNTRPCGDQLPKPSGGRLSTTATAPPPSDDPCDLAPGSGYRGLENRLYRVEVHTGGALAAVRFKWSRDNASVVGAVTDIAGSATASDLTVTRIGRDAVLRFAKDDWVEVTDDVRELMGEPGEMAQVAHVDEATRTITLDRKISAGPGRSFGTTPQQLADRHTRLRRWDQSSPTNTLNGDGLLAQTPGQWIKLGDGVEIQLSQAGSDPLKTGDYWVFAARAVDGSVEILDQAAPRGIRHHYSQLAGITAAGEVHDCRHLWPGAACCCCTAEVGDGTRGRGDFDNLREALSRLASEVAPDLPIVLCLLPGTYHLRETITVLRDRVTIRGCGRSTHVIAPTAKPAFELAADFGTLEGIYLTVPAGSLAPAIKCRGRGNRVADNEVVTAGGIAIWCSAADFDVVGNRLSQAGLEAEETERTAGGAAPKDRRNLPALLVLDGGTRRARVTGNQLGPGAGHGIGLTLSTLWDLAIDGNEIRSLRGSGIASIDLPAGQPDSDVEPHFDEEHIAEAIVLDASARQSFSDGAASIHHVPTPQRIERLRIERNTIAGCARGTGAGVGPPLGGIVLSRLQHVQISENRIEGNGWNQKAEPVAGIFIDDCKGLIVRDNVVVDNGPPPDGQRIPGPQGGILADKLSVVVESVSLTLDGTRGPSAAIQPDGWPAAAIQDNLVVAPRGPALVLTGMGPMQVTGNRLTARDILGSVTGKDPDLAEFVGAVMIYNLGMPDYLFRQVAAFGLLTHNVDPPKPDASGKADMWTVGGKVDFSHNQVSLDLVRGEAEIALAAVGILTLDDLSLQDNQTECTLLLDLLLVDMFVFAMTVRANGNGCTESWLGVWLSLWAIGLLMSTGVANQGTHCIRIDGPSGRVRDDDNLALFCHRDVQELMVTEAQDNGVQSINI